MTTFTAPLLIAVAFIVMLGGALTFAWLCGLAAGRTVSWAMQGDAPGQAQGTDDPLTPERIAKTDALVAESQRLLRESERRAAFSHA